MKKSTITETIQSVLQKFEALKVAKSIKDDINGKNVDVKKEDAKKYREKQKELEEVLNELLVGPIQESEDTELYPEANLIDFTGLIWSAIDKQNSSFREVPEKYINACQDPDKIGTDESLKSMFQFLNGIWKDVATISGRYGPEKKTIEIELLFVLLTVEA